MFKKDLGSRKFCKVKRLYGVEKNLTANPLCCM